MDWAKYTDEGWYGDAAIRHYQWGHWNVPGDFNPGAALPVWPLIEAILFHFTGVSLVAARALTVCVFGAILGASYILLRSWAPRGRTSFAPGLAVLLLASNPFCFVFTRMAILEPLLVLLTLAALILAARIGGQSVRDDGSGTFNQRRINLLSIVGLGVVLPLMVFTKTTGLFLFPAVFYALWSATGRRWKPFFRAGSIALGLTSVLWLSYYWFFVRPDYLSDYGYLFSANTYTKITPATFWSVLHDALLDGTWIGGALFWSSLIALGAWLILGVAQRLRAHALPITLVLWVLGYTAFLVYHANFAPRYYTVIAVPLVLLLAMAFETLVWFALSIQAGPNIRAWFLRVTAAASAVALLFVLINGARQTVHYVIHPEYSFLTAVHRLHDAVQREKTMNPRHSSLVLSISGSDISLISGLQSICDDFGTMELPDRVATYKPGWFAAWNDVEDDKMAALAPMYRLVRVGAYPAYDDPERNLLILYRLDPVNSPRRGRSGPRKYFINPHQRKQRKSAAASAAASR
jgi:hypothetical protein